MDTNISHLTIDSTYRISGGICSNFEIKANIPKDVDEITITRATRPESVMNVSKAKKNNVFSWMVSVKELEREIPGTGTRHVMRSYDKNKVTIPSGYYTTQELCDTLDKHLKRKGYSCTYTENKRVIFKMSGEDSEGFTPTFKDSNLHHLLGFNDPQCPPCGQFTGSYVISPGIPTLYVAIEGLCVSQIGDLKYTFSIPVSGEPFIPVKLKVPSNVDFSTLKVCVYFRDGIIVDMNNTDWEFDMTLHRSTCTIM